LVSNDRTVVDTNSIAHVSFTHKQCPMD